ncbi:hypothetical protein BD289DRAFT_483356, partial [Coniella lustricola]
MAAAAVAVAHPVAASFSTPSAAAPPGQPDIEYAPDHAKYLARGRRRQQTEVLPKSVPEAFPKQLSGSLVWEGETLAENYDWTYVFNKDQLAEIDTAVKHFK